MILPTNIDMNSLNLINQNSTASTKQLAGFEDILNELFKILFENQKNSTNNSVNYNFFVFPFPFLQTQEITFTQTQIEQLPQDLKLSLLNLFKSGQIDMKELKSVLQNLHLNKSEFQNLIEKIDLKNLSNQVNNQTDDSVNQLNSLEPLKARLSHSLELSKLDQNEFPVKDSVVINESTSKNQSNNSKILIEKSLTIENDTKLNIFHTIQSKSSDINDVQQKVELPFTQLKEISNIVFKALSNSQKTLIVQLEPPELGKILIKLSMDNAGIRADMKVDYPHVKEALTGLIPEIKSNLQSSGVKVSDFLLDLMKENRGYSDSYNGQGQRKHKGNQKFFEYFV
ncbi:hook-length control protein FliK [Thermodesulfovibrio aggregans]|uniref:Hook-length control protein FliK n=1 Tax=Thermodesulfovibrio aggregans TaxID=86166 RepID=A0A0U9HN02_9BACT|nr:flagellar hook-length control protein FliK [Thermodesulfovibrio aggregans]GAQ94440.1 hook-length control protein FliK [Thermodesulfovibrio aggregans]